LLRRMRAAQGWRQCRVRAAPAAPAAIRAMPNASFLRPPSVQHESRSGRSARKQRGFGRLPVPRSGPKPRQRDGFKRRRDPATVRRAKPDDFAAVDPSAGDKNVVARSIRKSHMTLGHDSAVARLAPT
jgi:hypothetical protein